MKEFKEKKYYNGKPLESGGTSRAGAVSPGIKFLHEKGYFDHAKTMLDYGAGKYGRNAEYLRQNGFRVFAYDPFNGNNSDGWQIGKVSIKSPKGELFDVAFSSFVLNVVPFYIEGEILNDIKQFTKTDYHITRNKDIFDTVKKALYTKATLIYNFFIQEYKGDPDNMTDKIIMNFCEYGVQTTRGFQRIPLLDIERGYNLIKNTSGYKVFV